MSFNGDILFITLAVGLMCFLFVFIMRCIPQKPEEKTEFTSPVSELVSHIDSIRQEEKREGENKMPDSFYVQALLEVAKTHRKLTPKVIKEFCDCFCLSPYLCYKYCNLLESKGLFKKVGTPNGDVAWFELIK